MESMEKIHEILKTSKYCYHKQYIKKDHAKVD